MKIKKSNFWIFMSNLIAIVGVGGGLLACAAVAGLKLAGYEVKIPVPWVDGFPKVAIDWKHFLYAGVAILAAILISVIFRSIGNAVYNKRKKKALEEARKAQQNGGLLGELDPETREQVVATAKKVVPIVAAVVVTCVVVKAVKKSQAKKRMEEMRMPRYYYY